MANADFNFQKLEIYNLGKGIVKACYAMTNSFPEKERYALIQQMNRAAISVPSNIAEGVGRKTSKDREHFINMAYGSLMELICQTEIALELGYIEEKVFKDFIVKAKNLSVKMSNFVSALQKG